MKHWKDALRRMTACLLALLLTGAVALAESPLTDEETIMAEEMNSLPLESEMDEEAEENAVGIFEPEVGSFAWYLEPVLPIEMHAYVDIYPEESPVYAQADATSVNGQSWRYAFTLEETGGYDFYPAVLTVVYFAAGDGIIAVSRESYDATQLSMWWGSSCIPAGSAVTYTGSLPVQDVCAVAISVIGNDAQGMEMEFHGVVNFVNEVR